MYKLAYLKFSCTSWLIIIIGWVREWWPCSFLRAFPNWPGSSQLSHLPELCKRHPWEPGLPAHLGAEKCCFRYRWAQNGVGSKNRTQYKMMQDPRKQCNTGHKFPRVESVNSIRHNLETLLRLLLPLNATDDALAPDDPKCLDMSQDNIS